VSRRGRRTYRLTPTHSVLSRCHIHSASPAASITALTISPAASPSTSMPSRVRTLRAGLTSTPTTSSGCSRPAESRSIVSTPHFPSVESQPQVMMSQSVVQFALPSKVGLYILQNKYIAATFVAAVDRKRASHFYSPGVATCRFSFFCYLLIN